MLKGLGVQENKYVYCRNLTCLTRTCSKHRCHHPKRWSPKSIYYTWGVWGPKDEPCEMYKGIQLFETLVEIPEEWDVEEDE